MEALVARLPRMLSDSGRLMTGSRGHSESERAGATLQAGSPLSLGPVHAGRTACPARRDGGRRLLSHPSFHGARVSLPQAVQTLNELDKHKVDESSMCMCRIS